jgi:hypothetical protein
MQRESSIEDQVRQCREFALRQGWSIVEDFVIADRAISAASVAGRDGLQKLVEAVKRNDCPFDCLLVDDTSRLAREMSDALRTWKTLEFYGVAAVSVTQGIDSFQGNARPLIAMHGIMDEQYLADLAKKVHRGQRPSILACAGRIFHGNVGVAVHAAASCETLQCPTLLVLEDGTEGKGGRVAGVSPAGFGAEPQCCSCERIPLANQISPKTDVQARFLLTAN